MYGRTFVILCLAAAILSGINAQEEEEEKKKGGSRIVNGQVININQAPYTVQLRFIYGGPFCGGTLVHPQYVVTAAHCFDQMTMDNTIVVAGANTRTDRGVQSRIVGMIKPSGYTSTNMNNDVAILKLETPVYGANIAPVPLCSRPLSSVDTIQVSGWGHTSSGGYGSDNLLTIRIPIISNDQCNAYHRNTAVPVTSQMVCAHNNQLQDSCQGDSGGPAISRGELCGIVSWGVGCAAGLPGIYTNVYNLRSFINEAMISLSRK